MAKKLNAKQLRVSKPTAQELSHIQRNPISLVLDNVQDTYNIGSFFRLADAVAAEKIYLCGKTVAPPNIKIHRASIGTWRWLDWEHYQSTVKLVKKLKNNNTQIVAAELGEQSINYRQFSPKKNRVALIAGNESTGISHQVLDLVDQTVSIPMHGINKSLNVLVSTSVISYDLIDKLENVNP